jgi:hypothetical protein
MKIKLLFICIISLFVFLGCNNDRIELEITSPKEKDIFKIDQSIEVKVNATTKKGQILQVQLEIENLFTKSLTDAPYNFTIPPQTFKKTGEYTIAIIAYSSEGMQEGDGVRVKITE